MNAEQVLAQHQYGETSDAHCLCGHETPLNENTDMAAHQLEALRVAGLSVVKTRDITRALSAEPNFLDAGGRLLETARRDRSHFLACCPHPPESIAPIDDGSLSCWRCDQTVAAAEAEK